MPGPRPVDSGMGWTRRSAGGTPKRRQSAAALGLESLFDDEESLDEEELDESLLLEESLLELLLEPLSEPPPDFLPLKSVSYQPVPFNWNAGAERSFFNASALHSGQVTSGSSLNFWMASN